MSKQRKCVFSGTFDPPTLGHQWIIQSARQVFDEVVVAVMVNPQKQPLFSFEQRRKMLELTLGDMQGIRVIEFFGTVAELLEKENTKIYVRGIRNGTDLDFENANFYASKKLDKDLIAVYLPCRQELLHVSSSMVRNSLKFGTPYHEYVSEEVLKYIQAKK